MAINTHGNKIHDNRDMPLLRGRPLHHADTSRTSEKFAEINYTRIGLSIADITVL
jgi:hypothetical protein